MSTVTVELLELAYGKPRRGVKFAPWCDLFDEVALTYALDTPQRLASFLAQVGHESGRLLYMREIWGPAAQQLRYEPVTPLSKVLGNVHKGDGKLFMGHGPVQVTGRANHASMRDRLRKRFPELRVPDFEQQPELLSVPMWGLFAAGEFWASRKLNDLADLGDQRTLRKRVNGGFNGLADCLALYSSALGACFLCGV